MTMEEDVEIPHQITEEDIVFECPSCGKSLVIDQRGAGMVISCSDCNAKVKVPSFTEDMALPTDETTRVGESLSVEELAHALEAATARADALGQRIDSLARRREELEKFRSAHGIRMDGLRNEIGLIQDALDRVFGLLQDLGEAPAASPEEEPKQKK